MLNQLSLADNIILNSHFVKKRIINYCVIIRFLDTVWMSFHIYTCSYFVKYFVGDIFNLRECKNVKLTFRLYCRCMLVFFVVLIVVMEPQ